MEEFIRVSRSIGKNVFFVQGTGGNSSMKEGEYLIIKSTGTRLAEMSVSHGYAVCGLKEIASSRLLSGKYSQNKEKNFLRLIERSVVPHMSKGKPSMEVGFHAVIPSKYVFHLHHIYANVLLCMEGGEVEVGKIMEGIRYKIINYTHPGYSLALALKKLSGPPPVILLKNHGIVVHGNTLVSCVEIIRQLTIIFERYIKQKNVDIPFCSERRISANRNFLFPDAAVYGDRNKTIINNKNIREVSSANDFIKRVITKLHKKPLYLSKKDVLHLRGMEQEVYRRNLIAETNMLIIIHRVNSIKMLKKIPTQYGVEVDVRADRRLLVLNHDPYKQGELLDEYLEHFNHKFIIFNIKEAGIEDDVIKTAKVFNLSNYFLLDVEFPYIYRATRKGFKKIAIRYSEDEPIEQAIKYKGKVEWVWIDTNTKLPIQGNTLKLLKGFNTCLVSPDRWGRPEDIKRYKKRLQSLGFRLSAVMCSLKYASSWES